MAPTAFFSFSLASLRAIRTLEEENLPVVVGWLSVPVVYYTTEEKENCAYSHRCGDSTASRYIYSRRGFFSKKGILAVNPNLLRATCFLNFFKKCFNRFFFPPHRITLHTPKLIWEGDLNNGQIQNSFNFLSDGGCSFCLFFFREFLWAILRKRMATKDFPPKKESLDEIKSRIVFGW